MRLPFPRPILGPLLLSCALAAGLGGAPAIAKPKPMMGKQWRAEDLEQNRPDENYKPPTAQRPNLADPQRTIQDPKFLVPSRQSDIFNTAAEHAVYLQAYQMFYGPYGSDKDPAKRAEQTKKTALAIEECLKTDCPDEQKKEVLKALVQYNFGKETQRMALTNRTNAEKMKSLPETESEKVFELMRKGSAISGGRRKDADLVVQSKDTKEPYYQLSVPETKFQLTPKELEIVGPEFLNTYRGFVRRFTKPDPRRHYKWVEASKHVYVHEESKPSAKDQSVMDEQGNERIAKIVDKHLKDSLAPKFGAPQMIDGKLKSTISGETGTTVGFGDVQDTFRKKEGGKPNEVEAAADYEKFPAYAERINEEFKKTAEKRLQEGAEDKTRLPAQAGSDGASGASRFQPDAPKEMAAKMTNVNISVAPEEFDKFLDQIWPPSVERQKLLKSN